MSHTTTKKTTKERKPSASLVLRAGIISADSNWFSLPQLAILYKASISGVYKAICRATGGVLGTRSQRHRLARAARKGSSSTPARFVKRLVELRALMGVPVAEVVEELKALGYDTTTASGIKALLKG